MQYYRKYHLVPFGEYVPLRSIFGFIYEDLLNMPFNDLSRGSEIQPPIDLNNQKLGLNICYEDVFGYEIIKSLPEATILVNLSNDAWYGESIAASQHLQISQARAMETQRMMLRATNTGVTAIIDKNGRLINSLPQHQVGLLDGFVQGYKGAPHLVDMVITLLLLCAFYIFYLL